MLFRSRLKKSPQFAGIRISPLLVMAKAVIWACQRNPTVNSTWTDHEIVVHHYVNLGIAAATPRGLIVPNIKDAHLLTLRELGWRLEGDAMILVEDGAYDPTGIDARLAVMDSILDLIPEFLWQELKEGRA